MAVTIRIECQRCEDIIEDEMEGVLVLGIKVNEGVRGTQVYYHDLDRKEILIIIGDLCYHLAEETSDNDD